MSLAEEQAAHIKELRIKLKECRYVIHHSDNYLMLGDEDPLTSDLLELINVALGED